MQIDNDKFIKVLEYHSNTLNHHFFTMGQIAGICNSDLKDNEKISEVKKIIVDCLEQMQKYSEGV